MNGANHNRAPVAIALAVSLGLHLGLYALLGDDPPPKKVVESVEFEIVERTPPPAAPEPEPEPEPAPEPEPPPPPPPPKVAEVTPRPPPQVTPPPNLPPPNVPPPNEPPPPDAKPAPIKIGISLSSTTEGGDFAVGTGNTLYGKADTKAADPNEVRPYAPGPEVKKAPFVPASRVSKQPAVRREAKAAYTAVARREGVEGVVILRVKIDENGKVVDVKVVKGIGYGLDEAAAEAMWKYLFAPASVDGQAVGTEISFKMNFLLE